MQKVVKRSVAPIYAVAAVWVIAALFFPLYKPIHFLTVALLSIAVFALVRLLDKGTVIDIPEEPVSTGNADVDALLKQRDEALQEMRRLNDNIEDEYISARIDDIENVTAKIFDVVKEKPEKASSVKKFMNYYLPTTLKMLDAYDKMSDAGISGENIDATKQKIESIMDTVVAAFNKQLDGLYGAEALDISTDITVLENMLAREGLTDQQLKPMN